MNIENDLLDMNLVLNSMNKELKEKNLELYKEVERLKKNQRLAPEERNHLHLDTDEMIENLMLENERLNKKFNRALELLADYVMPCEFEECIIPDDYCKENCSDDYKKCWNKYIELELKGVDKK